MENNDADLVLSLFKKANPIKPLIVEAKQKDS